MDLERLRRRLPPAVAAQWETLQAEFARTSEPGSDFLAWLRSRHLVDEALLRKGTDQLELSQWPLADEKAAPALPETGLATEPNRYLPLGELGTGSVGQIALMKDRSLKRKVAVKQIRPELALHPQVLSRFLTEAQITAQLDHPGIVPVYGLEVQANGNLAYAMKLIQGKTLKDLIREARLVQGKQKENKDPAYSLATRLEHFLKVCDALDYAHSRGVIHRDLKPANIMIGPFNEVYVMDWGIARRIQDHDEEIDPDLAPKIAPDQGEPLQERTQIGEVLGTPRYMSPQQAAGRNRELDGRSDQFSLGLILYELVSLKPAFEAKNALELLQKVLKAQLEPLSSKQAPAELRAIIAKATQLHPSDRYASVREMAEDLRRFLRGEAVLARPDTGLQKILRWMGEHRQATLSLALGIFVVGLSGLSLSVWMQQQTLLKIQAREQKMTPLIHRVSRLSQDLRHSLLQKEALLEGISAPAIAALTEGYPAQQQGTVQNAPPKEINFQAPYYSGDPRVFKQAIALLTPLHPIYRNTLLESAHPGQAWPPLQQAEAALKNRQTPITQVGLLLTEGLSVVYPGQNLPQADGRKENWYRQSLPTDQIIWTPLKGSSAFRLSQGLLAVGRSPLGVAYADLSAQTLLEHLKRPQDLPALKGLYLLDAEGQELLRSADASVLDPQVVPMPADLRKPGFREQQDQLLIWQPLHQGWRILALVDLKALLDS